MYKGIVKAEKNGKSFLGSIVYDRDDPDTVDFIMSLFFPADSMRKGGNLKFSLHSERHDGNPDGYPILYTVIEEESSDTARAIYVIPIDRDHGINHAAKKDKTVIDLLTHCVFDAIAMLSERFVVDERVLCLSHLKPEGVFWGAEGATFEPDYTDYDKDIGAPSHLLMDFLERL